MDVEEQIRQFVAKNLLFSEEPSEIADEASFLDEGIIDSLGVVELVTFVSCMFQVSVEPAEIVPDNFDSVSKLARYIRLKLSAPKQALR